LVPDGDGLIWEAAVGEGNDYRRSDLQDTLDLAQDGHRICWVVNEHADSYPIELCIPERELRIRVEVLHHVLTSFPTIFEKPRTYTQISAHRS
jgi:hypothetical protein